MYRYHCLNPISQVGLETFTEEYVPVSEPEKADAILVRSTNMKEMEFAKELKAIARAGAGVNNIPLEKCALTVKKAYDALTEEGFIITIHGKGSFVAFANQNVMLEEKRKEVETDLEMAIRKGRSCGMSKEELKQLFEIIVEE